MDKVIVKTRIVKKEGEYIVKAYNDKGQHIAVADYFTDDREDARITAEKMVRKSGKPIRTYKLLDNVLTVYKDGNHFAVKVMRGKKVLHHEDVTAKELKNSLKAARFFGYKKVSRRG